MIKAQIKLKLSTIFRNVWIEHNWYSLFSLILSLMLKVLLMLFICSIFILPPSFSFFSKLLKFLFSEYFLSLLLRVSFSLLGFFCIENWILLSDIWFTFTTLEWDFCSVSIKLFFCVPRDFSTEFSVFSILWIG